MVGIPHMCDTRTEGGGLKDFFCFAFQHTNRVIVLSSSDCSLSLFCFVFSLSFVLVVFLVWGRVFQFSRFGDFTLTLSLFSSRFVFFMISLSKLGVEVRESICHPAHLRSARFHEGSSTVLASVAA